MEKPARHFLPRANFGKGTVRLSSRLIWNAFLFVPTSISAFIISKMSAFYGLLNRRVRRANYGAIVIPELRIR